MSFRNCVRLLRLPIVIHTAPRTMKLWALQGSVGERCVWDRGGAGHAHDPGLS